MLARRSRAGGQVRDAQNAGPASPAMRGGKRVVPGRPEAAVGEYDEWTVRSPSLLYFCRVLIIINIIINNNILISCTPPPPRKPQNLGGVQPLKIWGDTD